MKRIVSDKEIIDALRATNGYSRSAARRLDCPEGLVLERIRSSPRVGKVLWAIVRARKAAHGLGGTGKTKPAGYRRKPSARQGYSRHSRRGAHARSDENRQCGLFDNLEWLSEPWNG